MTETQEPFEGEKPSARPTLSELLLPASIDRAVDLVGRGSSIPTKNRIMADATELLVWIKQPAINSTLDAMAKLQPAEAAIVNQLAVALLDAGTKRAKMIELVRRAMDEALQ